MFETISVSPVDPIFRVMAAFQADPRQDKIDLGIGILRDPRGQTPVMQAVSQAEHWLQRQHQSKAYLGPAGRSRFNEVISKLLCPEQAGSSQLAVLQTPGGTGALRVAGDLINRIQPGGKLWLSDPPWVTHHAIFPAAGLNVTSYRYLEQGQLDFTAMLQDLQQANAGDTVLLQVAGHNPTGCDPTPEQWHQLAQLLAERRALPLLDLAYHGLATNLQADSQPLAIINQYHSQWLCCYSCSKTFGLYNERTGALMIHSENAALTAKVRQEAINRICSNYYMPPDHGAAIVATIMDSTELRSLWQLELNGNRHRIDRQRQQLQQHLQQHQLPPQLTRPLGQQHGLFSYLQLSTTQQATLAQQQGIYVGAGGRINLSGLNRHNLQRISEGLATVLRKQPLQKTG
ncbi:MAG: aromatic amino acid transaminase [Marinobacterium sp.]|nr:aromatic amino acid transaminase [Marinobacterium sp.]